MKVGLDCLSQYTSESGGCFGGVVWCGGSVCFPFAQTPVPMRPIPDTRNIEFDPAPHFSLSRAYLPPLVWMSFLTVFVSLFVSLCSLSLCLFLYLRFCLSLSLSLFLASVFVVFACLFVVAFVCLCLSLSSSLFLLCVCICTHRAVCSCLIVWLLSLILAPAIFLSFVVFCIFYTFV